MEALVNLQDCKEYMTIVLNDKQHCIKLAGTVDEPYFCGKDVCEVLGYEAFKIALQRHVEDSEKTTLRQIIEMGTGAVPEVLPSKTSGTGAVPEVLLGKKHEKFVGHEGRTVYITEAGLYDLVLASQAPFAKQFKRLVTKVILPSIRQYGSYSITRELENKLALVEAKAIQDIAFKDANLAKISQELELANKRTLHLKQMVLNEKARTPEQVVYIATTKQYAQQNRFKVGGCKSRHHLRSRLATYNSGRPVGDKMYYAALFDCVDYVHLESRIKAVLGVHREIKEAEVYNLHYDALNEWIGYLTERYNEEGLLHRNKLNELIDKTTSKPPVVPEPIVLNGVEYRIIKNGRVEPTVLVDLDEMENEEKQEWLVKTINEIFDGQDDYTIERKELFERMIREYGAKFNKRKMWPVIKTLTTCRGYKITY